MGFETAGQIVSDVAVEVGLLDPGASAVFTSTDANIVQMRRLLKIVGRELQREFAWSALQKTHSFTTSAGVDAYALPSDFGRMADQTQWNRTEQRPLVGPLSAQGWQVLKSGVVDGAVDFYFRVYGGDVVLHPVPTGAESIAYEYLSSWWTCGDSSETPTKEAPTAYTDVVLFDPHLFTRRLKLAFLEAKGFDTTAAMRDYERALVVAQGGDGAAPILSLNANASPSLLLNKANIPDTGFGS